MPSTTSSRIQIAIFLIVFCAVSLVSVVAFAQIPQKAKPTFFRDARGQPATLTRTNGFVINGAIHDLSERVVQINSGRHEIIIDAKNIRSLVTQEDTFTFNEDTKLLQSARDVEARRSGEVKIFNNTPKQVTIIVTGYRDKQGRELRLEDDRSKSNLETALDVLSGASSNAKPRPLELELEPNETASLKKDGEPLVTSTIWYNLKTTDGLKSGSAAKDKKLRQAADFLVPIGERDLHAPVLVKTGKWNLEQDIWFTTVRERTPGRIVPVKGLFSGKIEHYDVYGGEDVEFTKENRSGHATAWVEIENPTDKTLEVAATVEFRFSHLLLSHERVNATITVEPKAKTKMFITVNTLAIVGPRKATTVSLVDLKTTPK